MAIIEAKVKPERMLLRDNSDGVRRRTNWWQFGRYTPALFRAVAGLNKVLALSQTSKYRCLTFLPLGMVYDQKLIVFSFDTFAAFCVLQSRVHENWALFFGSSMKDDLRLHSL